MASGGDKSGRGKNLTEQGALTSWRWHREGQVEGQVRTWKESNQARGTHILETASGVTSQDGKNPTERGALTGWIGVGMDKSGNGEDIERIRPSKGHSPTGDSIRSDKSGHGTKSQ